MTAEELRRLVQSTLKGLENEPGNVLGVGPAAVTCGDYYIMGFNPGGSAESSPGTIYDSIEERPLGWSVHTHDCWKCNERPTCVHTDSDGRVGDLDLLPHQRRVAKIYEALDVEPGHTVSTNAIFARSPSEATLRGATKISSWGWWDICWPVHRELLKVVRPKRIITLGRGLGVSAFAFLLHKAGLSTSAVSTLGGPGRRDGRWFEGRFDLDDNDVQTIRVIGLPHPSYYEISPKLAQALSEYARGVRAAAR